MEKFVSVYDDVVPNHICERIIALFEECKPQQMKSNVGDNVFDVGYRQAIELNCSKQDEFKDVLGSHEYGGNQYEEEIFR